MFRPTYRLSALVLSLCFCGAAAAQEYPSQAIRMVVPFPAGGVTDIVARVVSAEMSKELGQTIVVENMAGASGVIGSGQAAKAAADGYTLLMGNISTLAVNTATFKELPYDPIKSFTPISMVALQPLVVAVHPSVPAKNIKELVELAASKPGTLNYGTAGTSIQLATELFNSIAGIKMVHVPYKGSAPAVTDLVGGQIDVLFDPFVSLYPQVAADRVRGLAVTTSKRSSQAPELPTVEESGYADYDVSSWQGIVVPAGTPEPIIEKLHAAIDKALNMPEVQKQLADRGVQATPTSRKEFTEYIASEIERWQRVAKEAGVQPN